MDLKQRQADLWPVVGVIYFMLLAPIDLTLLPRECHHDLWAIMCDVCSTVLT